MNYNLLLLALAALIAMLTNPAFAAKVNTPRFVAAQPVWIEGRDTEMNLSAGFRASFTRPAEGTVTLRATGSSAYRVFVNGTFLGHGPARGPHGFYRVDEWDLAPHLKDGPNVVAFEVAGYNVNSYYLLNQPSFLQAEVVCDTKALVFTGGPAAGGFSAHVLPERVQKVQRYSFQRPFSEIYRIAPGWADWRDRLTESSTPSPLAVHSPKRLLARELPHPDYFVRQPQRSVFSGTFTAGHPVDKPWKDRSLTGISPTFRGYPEPELESIPSLEMQGLRVVDRQALQEPYSPTKVLPLSAGAFRIVDYGVNLTGFIGTQLSCETPVRLALIFDEMLTYDDIDFKRMNCVNIVEYRLEPGRYLLETFEPYTFRYLKLCVLEGACTVDRLHLREYAYPGVSTAQFACSDEQMNRLFAAGVETFRQNALDTFTDCPSRERAGWLCDSFFTARVARDLCGDTRSERAFLMNFLLPESFHHIPEGMLPMCYPADHDDGVFIPNWALWFVLQLEEYLQRTGDRDLVRAFEPRVLKLFEYFRPFQNSDGLLEGLKGWVFIEWSAANSFVQDVNYPSNMLFARALIAAGRLFNRPELLQQGQSLRQTIQEQSFDGQFFVDNAVRQEGKLQVTTNRTEVCQYFAFYFDVATPESHPLLWQTLRDQFGPHRKERGLFPEVHAANAFVGNVLRLELLARNGLARQLLDESLAYQMYMVNRTGTLWENASPDASCNHGFASHGGVHVLYRDVLGLKEIDTVNKSVRVRFTDTGLTWCQGQVPTPHGPVSLRWSKTQGKWTYDLHAPAGYAVTVENAPDTR